MATRLQIVSNKLAAPAGGGGVFTNSMFGPDQEMRVTLGAIQSDDFYLCICMPGPIPSGGSQFDNGYFVNIQDDTLVGNFYSVDAGSYDNLGAIRPGGLALIAGSQVSFVKQGDALYLFYKYDSASPWLTKGGCSTAGQKKWGAGQQGILTYSANMTWGEYGGGSLNYQGAVETQVSWDNLLDDAPLDALGADTSAAATFNPVAAFHEARRKR